MCPAPRHSATDYQRGLCHCADGREQERLYRKRRREGRLGPLLVDATGTRRRLQGLMVQGWTGRQLADELGWASDARVRQIISEVSRVQVRTANAVQALAERLADQPGLSTRTRGRAIRRGYVPLWAWTHTSIEDPRAKPWEPILDEIAIERAMSGVRVRLTEDEFTEAVARLASEPYLRADSGIAALLHARIRRVARVREAAGVPQVHRGRGGDQRAA